MFLDEAFEEEERELIVPTTIKNNSAARNVPGNDTEDKVFLLSDAEVHDYLKNDSSIICQLTDYARTKVTLAGKNNECYWWLRSTGLEYETNAMIINMKGEVDEYGTNVANVMCAVRPALWVKNEISESAYDAYPRDPAVSPENETQRYELDELGISMELPAEFVETSVSNNGDYVREWTALDNKYKFGIASYSDDSLKRIGLLTDGMADMLQEYFINNTTVLGEDSVINNIENYTHSQTVFLILNCSSVQSGEIFSLYRCATVFNGRCLAFDLIPANSKDMPRIKPLLYDILESITFAITDISEGQSELIYDFPNHISFEIPDGWTVSSRQYGSLYGHEESVDIEIISLSSSYSIYFMANDYYDEYCESTGVEIDRADVNNKSVTRKQLENEFGFEFEDVVKYGINEYYFAKSSFADEDTGIEIPVVLCVTIQNGYLYTFGYVGFIEEPFWGDFESILSSGRTYTENMGDEIRAEKEKELVNNQYSSLRQVAASVDNVQVTGTEYKYSTDYFDIYDVSVSSETVDPFIAVLGYNDYEGEQRYIMIYVDDGKATEQKALHISNNKNVTFEPLGYLTGYIPDYNDFDCEFEYDYMDDYNSPYEYKDLFSDCFIDGTVKYKGEFQNGVVYFEVLNVVNGTSEVVQRRMEDGIAAFNYFNQDLPYMTRGDIIITNPLFIVPLEDPSQYAEAMIPFDGNLPED